MKPPPPPRGSPSSKITVQCLNFKQSFQETILNIQYWFSSLWNLKSPTVLLSPIGPHDAMRSQLPNSPVSMTSNLMDPPKKEKEAVRMFILHFHFMGFNSLILNTIFVYMYVLFSHLCSYELQFYWWSKHLTCKRPLIFL